MIARRAGRAGAGAHAGGGDDRAEPGRDAAHA
jgi:hypothetical protein